MSKMNTSQLENELLQYTKGLSKDALQEVINFVQFLRQKRSKMAYDNLTQDLSIMSLKQTEHLEEEFEDYKKIYPSELNFIKVR